MMHLTPIDTADDEIGGVKTCTRCATTAWHPDVRTCSFGDCPFRATLGLPANDICGGANNNHIDLTGGAHAAAN